MTAAVSNQSPDFLNGPWLVEVYSADRATYSGIRLENLVFSGWVLSFVLDGDVRTSTGGEQYRVRSGDIMLHPPGLPFAEISDRGGTHLWVHCRVLASYQLDLLQIYRIAPVVPLADTGRYEAVFMRLLAVLNESRASASAYRGLKLTTLMLQLVEMILESWERAGRPERSAAFNTPGDRFARLINRMSQRLRDRLTRDDLADIVQLHPNYLDRAFHRQYGLTPMQMLRDMRLDRAKKQLETTDDTLETIAEECGLTDASYLVKLFKRRYGALPGQYRESVRKTVHMETVGDR